MIALTAEEAGCALGLAPLAGPVLGVSIDSRSVQPGDLFVAIRGEQFDGHDYVGQAFAAGACGAVVAVDSEPGRVAAGGGSRALPHEHPSHRPVYVAPDTIAALGALARAVRRRSQACVIALTGSVGKTSTKDLLLAMANAGAGGAVVGTRANRNNEIGLPLTLLELRTDTQMAVVEMGMRGPGQIAALTAIAEPDVGLVTNVEPVHLELLGTLEAIARAKAELLCGLAAEGVGVMPAGIATLEDAVSGRGGRTVRFALADDQAAGAVDTLDQAGAELRADRSSAGGAAALPRPDVVGHVGSGPDGAPVVRLWWPGGQAEVAPPFTALHRLRNIVPAAAACYAAGLELSTCLEGLQHVDFSPGRGDEVTVAGVCLIDDTYNANPPAMRSALDTLVSRTRARGGRSIALLGDMLELGPGADVYHAEVGRHAAQAEVEVLWGVGPHAKAMVEGYANSAGTFAATESRWFADADAAELAAALSELVVGLGTGDVVLIKASRGMHLERLVDALRIELQRREA